MSTGDIDAIVIGSGAGGGAMAYALTHAGLRVLLLEAGPSYDPRRDYGLDRDDWEQRRFPHKVATAGRQSFAPMQKLSSMHDDIRSWSRISGHMVEGPERAAWAYHHVVGLGGSTLQYTGEAHRLHPAAMRLRAQFDAGADWPLTYAELEPYYLDAERITGVAGPPQDALRPRSHPFPLPPHAPSYASQVLARGCALLGYSWTPNMLAALSRPYDGRPGCNYCANCNRGCPRRDKGSVDVTFIRRAHQSGRCEIRTGWRVTYLETGAEDRVAAVHARNGNGEELRFVARIVVLAAGAVESPRLLLASAGVGAPDGIGNDDGQLGRHFMESIAWVTSALHPEPLGSHRGLPSDSICWDFNAPDAHPDFVGGCRFSPATAEADLVGPLNYARRVVGGWGRSHKAQMADTFGRVLSLGSFGEQLPNSKSYIDLDPTQRDSDGVPLARIHSHLCDDDFARLRFMASRTRAILAAAGAETIIEEYGTADAFSSTHVFGGCRMGSDPRTSVVDADCRSHRWRNLYIADASVFPSTGGGEAPALTIEALALRTGAVIAAASVRRDL